MKKTIKIEGMMSVNCENHVKKALGALENVTVESVSHEKDEAVVSLSADVPGKREPLGVCSRRSVRRTRRAAVRDPFAR